jgi:hypothetical protein
MGKPEDMLQRRTQKTEGGNSIPAAFWPLAECHRSAPLCLDGGDGFFKRFIKFERQLTGEVLCDGKENSDHQ